MRALVVLLAALCVAPIPASAQLKPKTQTGSLIPVKPQAVDTVRAGRIRKSFARCIFAHNSEKAAALLTHSDPTTVDFAAAGIPAKSIKLVFGMESCLGNEAWAGDLGLGMQFSSIRSLLQEEAYLAATGRSAKPLAPSASRPERQYVSTGELLVRAQGLGQFADCFVAADPVHADALLRTMPGSAQEAQASRLLAPSLGACLTAEQTIRFTPATIRALTADGAWQMLRYPATNGTAVKQ